MKKARLLIPALVALALACLVSLALTARAQAFIYWTDADTHSIGRSTLDGTGAQADFITGITRPGAMAVDNHYIYWADQETASIARAKLDGTAVDPDFITGIRYNTGYPVDNLRVTGVGVSPDHVYWATDTPGPPNDPPGFIGRADIDGTNVIFPWTQATWGSSLNGLTWWSAQSTGFATRRDSISGLWSLIKIEIGGAWRFWTDDPYTWMGGVTHGDSYVYWLCDLGLWREYPNLRGKQIVAAPALLPGADGPLAKQDAYLFWADDIGSRVGRIKKDGSGSTPDFLTAPVTPVGLATDGGKPATVTGLSARGGRRGALVTIMGRHFGARRGVGSVCFGRIATGRYLRWSDHKIVVAVPRTAPLGRVKLTVRTKYGPSRALRFTVRR